VRDAGIELLRRSSRKEGELPPIATCCPSTSSTLRSAIADRQCSGNGVQVQKLLTDIRGALAAGRGVYVHCQAGIGRTGLVMGCYLAEEDGDGKAAIKRLKPAMAAKRARQKLAKVRRPTEQATISTLAEARKANRSGWTMIP